MKNIKNTILIVDDDFKIRRMLKDYLQSQGYIIMEAVDGADALDKYYANNNTIDLILLDVMMNKMNGFDVLEELRVSSDIPVIMLTARGEEYDELYGLNKGADDYISKPFSLQLLNARIVTVIKRSRYNKANTKNIGPITIIAEERKVICEGNDLNLTPKEYDLLWYLISNENIVLSRELILNGVWGYDYEGDLRTVDTHIKQLRQKLGDNGHIIKTVFRKGYKLEV